VVCQSIEFAIEDRRQSRPAIAMLFAQREETMKIRRNLQPQTELMQFLLGDCGVAGEKVARPVNKRDLGQKC
jgi:Mg2+ and Co2+ transporter CorA